jgi:hypothetical protein
MKKRAKSKSKAKTKKAKKSQAVKAIKSDAGKKPYPLIDGHRKHYVQYPVQKLNGKWVGADVLLPSGYISVEDNPIKGEFDTSEQCQKACDLHNSFNGWTQDEANSIISESMSNSLKEQEA